MNLQKTKWHHKQDKDFVAKVTKHNPKTGRVFLVLENGKRLKTRIGNLRSNWVEVS